MTKNNLSEEFRTISLHFCPELKNILFHNSVISNSTWSSDISTGKAVELTALCATIYCFVKRGYKFILPSLYEENPDWFYLRNTIPRHHDAQAGHDSAFDGLVPLKDRFMASLVPKAFLKRNDEIALSVFREGHPIHKISYKLKTNQEYMDRPDIVIAQGEMTTSLASDSQIDFIYKQAIGTISGALRIKNDNSIPIISYEPISGGDVIINGIIECSVGKSRAHAVKQVTRYKTLFASVLVPATALVNGQKYAGKHIEHEIFLDLVNWNRKSAVIELETGFDKFAELIDSTIKTI